MSTSVNPINEFKTLLIRLPVDFPTAFKFYEKLEFLIVLNFAVSIIFGFNIRTNLDITIIII